MATCASCGAPGKVTYNGNSWCWTHLPATAKPGADARDMSRECWRCSQEAKFKATLQDGSVKHFCADHFTEAFAKGDVDSGETIIW